MANQPNPYQTSSQNDVDLSALPSEVNAPALGLVGVSGMWCFFLAMMLAANLYMAASGTIRPSPAPELFSDTDYWVAQIVLEFSMFVVSGIIFYSGLMMRQLQSYQLARIGAALAIIPCLGPFYVLGIPFGIWALLILNKPGVKEMFKS